MPTFDERYRHYSALLQRYNQSHLLAFWEELNEGQRRQLLDDLDQVDFERCAPLIDDYVRQRPKIQLPERVEPAPALPAAPAAEQYELYERARKAGADAIRDGRVAAFTVAGGQGTRLGFDGPKGAFPTSPIRQATLFQLFAEMLRGIARRYGKLPPWYIMTSPGNHADTVAFFEKNGFFNLPKPDVIFFPQGQMPAFLPDGRIALAEKHRLSLGPDGHGGSLRALAESGSLEDMRKRGIDVISYFQVDNPLVHAIDPLFIGLHLLQNSEMSSKAVHKADDLERVGNFALADGKLSVIEYSDLPEALAHSKNPDGSRRFDAGSVAIHVLSREFVERLTARGAAASLPWHRADKKLPVVDEKGQRVTPQTPNVVKLEMFVFDAIPLAKNPLVLFTRREEEFSPVKNAEGVDSAETARRDMVRRAARWLEAVQVQVPHSADGEPECTVEISPAFAVDAEDLRDNLQQPPQLERGGSLLLA